MAGREMTAWVAGLAFLSANLGSLELMGWAGNSYKYGILAAHWYWIGAIPAMLFLALVMMPFYHICKTHSVPGYLKLRFGPGAQALSSVSFAFMTVLMSGINMYAMAVVMQRRAGMGPQFQHFGLIGHGCGLCRSWGIAFRDLQRSPSVLLDLGGSAADSDPGTGRGRRLGRDESKNPAKPDRTACGEPGLIYARMWSTLGHFSDNPMGINWVGIVFGLGAVISMGYWTTDFLVVQRVLAAKDLRSPKLAPIIGAAFKMMVPFIVILPGLLGLALLRDPHTGNLLRLVPADLAWSAEGQAQGLHGYDEVLPLMLARYCGPGLLGLGITALIAGFMSGMAGNVSAFTTVWTYDIYGALINKNASDESKVSMGRWVTMLGVIVSIGTAYLVMHAQSIMDYVQALFSFFIAPLFGTVILGMLWKRATPAGGWTGLLAGTLSSVGMYAWVKVDPAAVRYVALSPEAQDQAQNMFRALWCWLICVIVTVVVSLMTKPKPDSELANLVYGLTPIPHEEKASMFHSPVFWGSRRGDCVCNSANHFLVGGNDEIRRIVVDLVLHRRVFGGEWSRDFCHGTVRIGLSTRTSGCALQLARQCLVGSDPADSRPVL